MSKLYSELFKGAWLIGTAYTIGDNVTHEGSSYTCIANSTGNTPPNDSYWSLIAEKGDQGIQGEQGIQGIQGPQGVPGDTLSPAINTDSYIPQWDGANSKTLKNGLAVPAGGLAGLTDLAALVPKSLYDANSILIATSDNTPLALTIGASTIVGRKASGDIVALTAAEARTILNVADGAVAIVKASGAEVDTGTDDAKFATPKAIADSAVTTATKTQTITNKRNQKRVVATTQHATPTINTDNGDIFYISGLAQAITSMTTNLTGTPVADEIIEIEFVDNGTARAITWGASFASTTVLLPTTTVISTLLRVLFQRNKANTVWDCIGVI